ncbi:putative fatty acyl-CoA reductase CG5065 isoform X2 [Bombyx mori]|uniref:Fatty acyl-CoA reductase n=2 Tax=Bombyx mori TaxID=7091 RepID=A0A8R2AP30_BOMMO|nr:putative fatty acyl-CoA reductase CG5065 [Bombyx mori]XP_037870512.1 putative fatty acyl-CoA reductase CG5065 [Bombyx mori]XP_037870513.1 putative fatty acyl-CoA reductase CG5065 [Bombyx mori]
MIAHDSYKSIPDFYAGKTVFITGGTGFLGKVLVEKLVYSCPALNKVYVLIRETPKQNVLQKLKQLLDSPIFTRLKNERPEDLNKIVPIAGDLCKPNLGLEPSDEEKLIDEVSVVIHSGATVKFNDALEYAMKINYQGTEQVMRLCRKIKNIKVFVYISTTYAHTQLDIIEEVIYPPPARVAEVYETIKRHGNNEKNISKILNGQPNTYAFTKALAENLVAENHGDIPTVVIRPSIITAGITEPLEGWVDTWNGATGIMHLIGKGLCRVLPGNEQNILDLIPVDFVCNLALVAAAKCNSSKKVTILNSCSGSCNPITLKQFCSLYCNVAVKRKSNVFPFPYLILFNPHIWMLKVMSYFLMTMAGLADFVMRIFGKQTMFFRTQSKLYSIVKTLRCFIFKSWVFKCERVCALNAELSDLDRAVFNCDPSTIHWEQYAQIYFDGVTKFLLEKPKNLRTDASNN